MKVLMTTDTVGGVWTYALQLCDALATHGVDVVLATMGAPLSAPQRAGVQALPNVRVHESALRLEWMPDPWADVRAAGAWLLSLEQRERPAVVHLNGYTQAALPWRAPVLVAGHSCVLSWWQAVHGTRAPAAWDAYRRAVRAGLQAASLVTAPTAAMLASLQEHYGPLSRTRVIPNGVSVPARRNAPAPPEPFVLAAGRVWDEAKNIAALAAVAPLLRWPLYVAGPCDHPAGEARPLPGVHLLGVLPADELRAWYRRAAVFVQPSLYEPFGLAPVEAALERCALVLGDIASLREVWGDAAVYVPPREPRAIARALNDIVGQPRALARLGRRARRRARTLNAAAMAAAYHECYRALVTRSAADAEVPTCVS